MPNNFLTPSIIAREALMVLRNNTVMAGLVHRDYSDEFVTGVGDTITIRKPATFEAQLFDRAAGIQIQEANEDSITVKLDKHLDVSFEVTDHELTMDIDDFSEQLLVPAMSSFAQKIDEYLTALYKDIPYFYGTAGATPAAVSDITGVRRIMNQNKVPMAQRRLVIDPYAEDKFLQLSAFHEADKVGDAGTAMREASLGRKFGFDTYMDQNIATHTAGDLSAANSIAVKGAVAAGSTTMTWDDSAAGALTGSVKVGDLFEVEGNQYVITADADAAANEIAVQFYPAAPAGGISDNAVVTFIGTDHTNNLAFHRNAFALVTRPLALPKGLSQEQKAVVNYDGFGLRVIYDYDSTYKKDVISIDMVCGVKTLTPELAVRLLG